TIQVAGDLTMGGLPGNGTLENGGPASKWIFDDQAADTSFSGTIRDNPNNAAVRLGLVKRGVGTLTLSGTTRTTDRFAIENGTLRLTGTHTAGFAAGGGDQIATVGSAANQN